MIAGTYNPMGSSMHFADSLVPMVMAQCAALARRSAAAHYASVQSSSPYSLAHRLPPTGSRSPSGRTRCLTPPTDQPSTQSSVATSRSTSSASLSCASRRALASCCSVAPRCSPHSATFRRSVLVASAALVRYRASTSHYSLAQSSWLPPMDISSTSLNWSSRRTVLPREFRTPTPPHVSLVSTYLR